MRYLLILTLLAISFLSLQTGKTTLLLERRIQAADSVKIDPETGLAVDNNLVLVRAHCTGCHSTKLILQNRFTRDGWKQKIRWMQRTQKLWDLGEAEPAVLDYLTKFYGPDDKPFDGRRLPLRTERWHSR